MTAQLPIESSENTMRIRHKSNTPMAEGDLLVDAADLGGDGPTFTSEEAETPTAATNGTPQGNQGRGAHAAGSRPRGLLGEVLVARGLVTEEEVALALQMQGNSGKRLGEVLVEMEALQERTLVDELADYFGMPVTDLRRDTPDPAAVALVPEAMAREQMAIPVHVDADGLHVAVAQPSDDLRFLLAETSGHSVRLRLAPLSDIRWAIDRSYQAIGSVDRLVQAYEAVEGSRKRATVSVESQATTVSENAPWSRSSTAS